MGFKNTRRLVLALLFVLPAFAYAVDTDRDGLEDHVEAALGSSPLHKDIFVEIDWFVVGKRNLKPRNGFVQIVTSIFESAPVSNPDGTTGIRIHIQLSNAIKVSGGTIGYMSNRGVYNWSDFDVIKSAYFTPSRRNTHHYVVFVGDIGDESGTASGISGISRNTGKFSAGASDFVVALGGNYWFNYPKKSTYKWTQVGTFVHELGHNLGLKHGGTDHFTYKPNNLSLLNYAFQVDGIPYTASDGSRYLLFDYSRQKLPTLRESSLNESNGLGPATRDEFGGVYGTTWYSWNGFGYDETTTFNASSNLDWNQNGSISGSFEDLNQDGRYGTLKGKEQWSSLVFTGGLVGGGVSAAVALPVESVADCLTSKEHASRKKIDRSALPKATIKEIQSRNPR
jgi:hypothetical protein